MRLFSGLFNFYINASIHVALAVCALVAITDIKFDLEVESKLYWFIFFATISGYNFIKYFGLAKFHHRSLASWLKQIQIFSFLCFIPLIYFTFKLDKSTLLVLSILGVITFFYAIPFLPKSMLLDKSSNLRAISGLKIYVIAIVWGGVTVLLPAFSIQTDISNDLIMEFMQRTLYVIIAMLPFEIRDLQYDSLKLATIPQQIGVMQTKWLGTFLIGLFLLLNGFKDHLPLWQLIADIAIALLTLILLWYSKTTQSAYFTSFWVEGIPIAWLGLVLLIR